MLKAIHAQENREAALAKPRAVAGDFRRQRMGRAAELAGDHVSETLTYYAFPDSQWIKLRTNNPLERIMREIRRRTVSGGCASRRDQLDVGIQFQGSSSSRRSFGWPPAMASRVPFK